MQITSKQNPLLKSVRRAAASGRPTDEGLIVAEGPHLLEEALKSSWSVEAVWARAGARERFEDLLERTQLEVVEVEERAFLSLSVTENSQGILSLLRPRAWNWKDVTGERALMVILDGVRDPGNAGTAVRSAEAFGATGVVLLKGCVHVANGKFLRAAAGSIFRIPFLENAAIPDLPDVPFWALDPRASKPIYEAPLYESCALITGGEGAGISAELLERAGRVTIPAHVESLNAAVACSIALFEAQRQRSRA